MLLTYYYIYTWLPDYSIITKYLKTPKSNTLITVFSQLVFNHFKTDFSIFFFYTPSSRGVGGFEGCKI